MAISLQLLTGIIHVLAQPLPSSNMQRLSPPHVDCSTGAPMGRRNNIPDKTKSPKLRMQKLRMIDGCYDTGGAYWGLSNAENGYLYWAVGDAEGVDEQYSIYLRASDREGAKAEVRELVPGARFYN